MQGEKPDTIDAYIVNFPPEVRELMEELRFTILSAAPEAVEVISYQMPAFKVNKVLVYFAGYKQHIGFYPTSSGIAAFQNEIKGFKNSKGAIQFPLNKPLPIDLITRIVQFRLVEDKLIKKNPKHKDTKNNKGHKA